MSELQDHRIAVQEVLLMFADKLKSGFDSPGGKNYTGSIAGKKIKKKLSKELPTDYIMAMERAAGRISYTKEDLQRFINGFDNLSISLLQPYVLFEKFNKKRKKSYTLNVAEANLNSFKRFLDGGTSGGGSIGFGKKKLPGGFGIKSIDVEYVTSEKSGYGFNNYLVEVELFCASMEDLATNLGSSDDPYTLFDVLIAFPEDVQRFQRDVAAGKETGELSSAYKTSVEFGYNLECDNNSEYKKIIEQQQQRFGIQDLTKLSELLKKMRFRLFLTPHKWTVGLEQKGNINIRISYFGYDNVVASKSASNMMALVSEVAEMQNRLRAGSPTVKRETEEQKKAADFVGKIKKKRRAELIEEKMKELVRRPYSSLGVMGRCFDAIIDYTALELGDKSTFRGKNMAVLRQYFTELFGSSATFENFKRLYKGYRPTPVTKWFTDYDFDKVLDDSSAGKHLTIENKQVVTEARVGKNNMSTYSERTYSKIPYFYLGDLLGWISSIVSSNLVESQEYEKGSFIQFVTDSIELPAPWVDGATVNLNIAEIPISWDFFLEWWAQRASKRKNLIYKLEEFLQEFFGHFLQSVFEEGETPSSYPIRIGCYVLETPIQPGDEVGARLITYYLYHQIPDKTPSAKFYIGSSRGLLKTISFDVVEDKNLKSAYMQMALENEAPGNNLQFQRAIYNCSLTMFGSTIFQPGMSIEVVPSIVGVPFSASATMRNIYDLGIGGIFAITKTKISLKQGSFETALTTRWLSKPETPGGGALNSKPDEQILDYVYDTFGGGGYKSNYPPQA